MSRVKIARMLTNLYLFEAPRRSSSDRRRASNSSAAGWSAKSSTRMRFALARSLKVPSYRGGRRLAASFVSKFGAVELIIGRELPIVFSLTNCRRMSVNSSAPRQWSQMPMLTTAVAEYLAQLERHLEKQGFNGNVFVVPSTGGSRPIDHARQIHLRVESGPTTVSSAPPFARNWCQRTRSYAISAGPESRHR